jgi:hypothetical protein
MVKERGSFFSVERLKLCLEYMSGVLEKEEDDKASSAVEITENYCFKIRQCILMSLTLLHTRYKSPSDSEKLQKFNIVFYI